MRGFAGSEQAKDPALSTLERLYVRALGVPVNGLRIRLRHVLPHTRGRYGSILDAGCGPGVFTMELAKRHPEADVVGIDLDEDAVQRAATIAERAGLENVRFQVADVTALPFDKAFDLVVSVDNLEHIEDDLGAMRNLERALRPGGKLVVHVPGYYRRWLVFGRRVNFEVPGHVRPGYTAEELTDKLERTGFRVEAARYTYGILETFTNNISYLITGARKRNRGLYALIFPFLLALSYLGKFSRPRWGAGVLATALRLDGGSPGGSITNRYAGPTDEPQRPRER